MRWVIFISLHMPFVLNPTMKSAVKSVNFLEVMDKNKLVTMYMYKTQLASPHVQATARSTDRTLI